MKYELQIHRLTDKEKGYIIEAYCTILKPMITIAKELGVTRQTIHKALKKAGIDTSKAGAAHISVSCTVCGNETTKLRYTFRKAKHHFCSEACYYVWLKHGNGNPLIIHRQSSRIAREIVERHINLMPGQIVHHEDRNQWNNDIDNLKVFANQGDHIRYHRDYLVLPIWDGKSDH